MKNKLLFLGAIFFAHGLCAMEVSNGSGLFLPNNDKYNSNNDINYSPFEMYSQDDLTNSLKSNLTVLPNITFLPDDINYDWNYDWQNLNQSNTIKTTTNIILNNKKEEKNNWKQKRNLLPILNEKENYWLFHIIKKPGFLSTNCPKCNQTIKTSTKTKNGEALSRSRIENKLSTQVIGPDGHINNKHKVNNNNLQYCFYENNYCLVVKELESSIKTRKNKRRKNKKMRIKKPY